MRIFALLCLVAVSAGAQEDEDRAEAERQLESGARLLEQGQADKARVRYEMAQRLLPDDPRPLLGLARADAAGHQCDKALEEIDLYLAKEKQPDPKALTVLSQCPRTKKAPQQQSPQQQPPQQQPPQQHQPPPTKPPAEEPKKPRAKLLTVGLEAGLNVPITSDTLHVDFLGMVELGVTVAPKIGLSVVLLLESLVSRAELTPGSTKLSTLFTENFLLGLEDRYLVWKRLLVFGTLAGGFAVDSFHGVVGAGIIHADVGLGWEIGPGEIRLRPLAFNFIFDTSSFGASWRASAGYAFHF
jgi:hypothetical protein